MWCHARVHTVLTLGIILVPYTDVIGTYYCFSYPGLLRFLELIERDGRSSLLMVSGFAIAITTRRRTLFYMLTLKSKEEGPHLSKSRIQSLYQLKIALTILIGEDPTPFTSFLTIMPAYFYAIVSW